MRVVPDIAGPGSAIPRAPPKPPTPLGAHTYGYTNPKPQGGSQTSGSCAPSDVLAVTFTSASTSTDGKLYGNLLAYGLLQVQPGDYFEYEIMWADSDCNCGAEFEIGHDYRLRDNAPLDANGYSPHSEKNSNMSARVTKRWYYRRWDLPPSQNNKFIDKWVFSALLTAGSSRTAFFKYVRLVRPGRPDAGKKVWEPEMAPIVVNTYFPGSITTRCQPLNVIEALEPTVHPSPASKGGRAARTWVSFSTVVTASRLDDADASSGPVSAGSSTTSPPPLLLSAAGSQTADPVSPPQQSTPSASPSPPMCSWPGAHPLDFFRELGSLTHEAGRRDTVVSLVAYTARLRHPDHHAVTLWYFGARDVLQEVNPPLPLPTVMTIGLHIPPESPLTELLRTAVWEINVTTAATRRGVDSAASGIEFQNTTIYREAFASV